nr:ABC transporter permease [Gemmatimonadota bacterium]
MLSHDIRYSARLLRRSPGFAAGTILVLALGIGATTAIFSVVDRVLVRPLPYHDPARLVRVSEVIPKLRDLYPSIPVTARHVLAFRERARSFEGFAALEGLTMNLTGAAEPERLGGAGVSWNFLRVLGVRPQLGRDFLEEEDHPGRDRVILISEDLWARRFRRDPHVLQRTVTLDGDPHAVIGVLPRSFDFARNEQFHHLVRLGERVDFYKPIAFTDEQAARQASWNYGVLARLRPGVSARAAAAELDVLLAELAKEFPEPIELRADVIPLQEAVVGGSRRALLVLFAAVGAVLLVACVNVANLLLVRGTVRQRETAVRSALGAGTRRLVRQSLTESALLAIPGGLLGAGLAAAGLVSLVRLAPSDLPRLG